ncbi:hypothetical protein WMF31_33880 [Sorangium sp. So ce1036]
MLPALRSAVEGMRDLATLRKWHLLAGTGTREAMHDALKAGSAARSS